MTPLKTDFSTWKQENLVKLAKDLLEENEKLAKDLKEALKAWRAAIVKIG